MSLRTNLLLLAMLAVLSAVIGSAVHYFSMQAAFSTAAERAASSRVEIIANRLEMVLGEQLRPAAVLADLEQVEAALATRNEADIARANLVLDEFNAAMEADVCYLMDADGLTVASSNRGDADSFVGMNFSFRPYFQEAMRGSSHTYMALGSASGKRGAYYSHPVYGESKAEPVGVAIIKVPVGAIEAHIASQGDDVVLVDPHGIIFIASRPDWLLHSLWELSSTDQFAIAATRQFGAGPWEWVGVQELDDGRLSGPNGEELISHQHTIARFPGWRLIVLMDGRYDYLSDLRRTWVGSRWMVIPVFVIICAAVALLYRRANTAQASLRENEERFRTLYHKTPAMLHSVDTSFRILRVSAFWIETMGYSADEVVGRRITDFMTEESCRHAEREVIPEFVRTGTIRDAAYQFVKKNGEQIDVHLSAISELDSEGKFDRSLAVMIDITEQKRTERRLEQAQRQLHAYSQDLERQVRERSREITDIVRYTPAVVSLKDVDGNYLLVNPRFEELFGVEGKAIRGRTGEETFPEDTARRLCAYDARVISTGKSIGVEERFSAAKDSPTFYSVKFPLFDDSDRMIGVGSISTDVTELKEAQETLRRLPARIVEGQENERTAVARELHDELGQSLTALKMDAAWLEKRLEKADPKAVERASEMCVLIDRTLDEVRGMVNRLRPGLLDDLGLEAALEWLADEFEKHTGVACTSRAAKLPMLEDAEAKAAYRIAQEALTNIARHADATRAHIELAAVPRQGARLTVTDDGRGFEVDLIDSERHHGIVGMRERAEMVGGDVTFAADPAGGTTVSFWLPLDENRWSTS